ncbi:TonB-dependent receptor [Niastella caeni]|uniref:TonB-dependent receptor n=1 Tax=Niastella caeni TaxID=2569763 RepID=A0A4S8HU14_9BACT|nr:TonB-dependent receptor [Niastella caeni]THU38119.1 TonB-dependent receptor [Niastella caeni]
MKQFLLVSAALAAATGTAMSQSGQTDSLKTQTLGQVVVTATRTEIQRNKTPQSITVINRTDIETTGGQEFTDLLKKNAAVNIVQYPGLLSGIGIRGFRPQTGGLNQRALLLIDGRPAGTANLATINPSDIERIEVLKGSASAIYGSQAMGGVVNVITRKSAGAIRSTVSAEYGSYQTFKGTVATGGNITDKLDFDLSFTTFDRAKNMKLGDGNVFRKMLNAETATQNFADGPVEADDKRSDGLRREYTRLNYNTGSIRAGYQLTNNWKVNAKAERFIAKNVESPSDIFYGNAQPSTKDIERYNSELSITGNLHNHEVSIRGYAAEEKNFNNTLISGGNFIAPYLSFQSKAEWNGVQLKDVVKLDQHTLIFGIDHNRASTTSRAYNSNRTERAPFSPNYSLVFTAAYVQGQLNFFNEKLILNPGIRYDLISYDVKKTPLLETYAPGKESNPFVSPSLAAQYQVLKNLTIHATVGRAYVTPDAYNVAGYSEIITGNKATVTQGNPDLKNENSITWDAGIRYQKNASGFAADLTYFFTDVKDRITTQRTTPTTTETTASGYEISTRTTYINANKGEIRGLEGEVSYDFGALQNNRYSLRTFINATKTIWAEEITIAANGNKTKRDIYNVASLTASYGIEYNNRKGLDVRLSGRYAGHRKDTDFNTAGSPEIEYPEFMVLDFYAGYTYAKKHTFGVFVNNITDENYYEKRGFNLQGRNINVRYSITF